MDNPLKKWRLARLCTDGLKKSLCGWAAQGGQDRGGTLDREDLVDLVTKGGFDHALGVRAPLPSRLWGQMEGERSRAQEDPEETKLRRGPEEKLGGGVAVSVKESFNDASGLTPWHQGPEAKGHQVACHFFPGEGLLPDCAEVIKPHKHPVPPAKPSQNNRQPAGNEPRRNQTFLVHASRCAKEALLTHLPVLKRQEECPDHCTDRVLKVGDQLDRQRRKGPSPFPAEKTSNGDLFFPELREELDGIPPIRGDFSIAIRTAADGARMSNRRRKINLTGQKRFPVFPKGFEFVKIGELNLSAPRSQGGRLLAAQTFGPASLLGLVIFSMSIPYLAHSSTLISSVRLPRQIFSPYRNHTEGDNSGREKRQRPT